MTIEAQVRRGAGLRVFLSYRRSDVGGYAGRLTDALAQRLGAKNVFQDVAAIVPGQDFGAAIDGALDECDAVLAVIGPGWIGAVDARGDRRLQQDDDYVRRELARALEREATVVPVLVGGTDLPVATELPGDLQGLSQRQAVSLRDETWHLDVDALLRSLRGEPTEPTVRGWRRRRSVAAATLVAVAAGAGVVYELSRDSGNSDTSSKPPACAVPGAGWAQIPLDGDVTATVPAGDGDLTFTVRSAAWKPVTSGEWQVTLGTTMRNATSESHYHYDDRYRYLKVGSAASQPGSCSSCLTVRTTRAVPST